MPTVFTLAANQITVSNGLSISGVDRGDGRHLQDQTLTLNSNNWQGIEVTDNDGNFQDNRSGNQRLTEDIAFNGTIYDSNLGLEAEYTVVFADPDGNEYTLVAFNIREPGAGNPYGTVEGLAFVGGVGGFPPVGVELSYVSHQEGPSVAYTTLATPPCFTKGALIDTPNGVRLIEELEIGDLVNTVDHGPKAVRWIAKTRLPAATLRAHQALRPILIKADAFGVGCPERDTQVSQQHRILVSGWQAALLYGEDEILVPAKKLLNDHSIVLTDDSFDVEYFHLVFEGHEILTVDGLKSESFFPSPHADELISVQAEMLDVFGAQALDDINVAPARLCVADRTTRLLDVEQ